MSFRTTLLLLFLAVASSARSEWARAVPGWKYEFPRDEFAHPEFKTEWWYFTGNLRDTESGRRFGYQLTFFRQGIRPPGARGPTRTGFVTDHFWFAHFAISDLERNRFHPTERASRGAFDEAGSAPSGSDDRLVWIGDWAVRQPEGASGEYFLTANSADIGLSLTLVSGKPPVFHGVDGVSAKSPEPGNASHYFSHTRLASSGEIRLGTRRFQVEGKSWFDREWSTSVLGEGLSGWDWFSIQLDNEVDVMLFQLRNSKGHAGFVSGTIVDEEGLTTPLGDADIRFVPRQFWKNPRTGVSYPIEWEVFVPSRQLSLVVKANLADQELRLAAATYWEGSTGIVGTLGGQAVRGSGYLEMTGYASDLTGLR